MCTSSRYVMSVAVRATLTAPASVTMQLEQAARHVHLVFRDTTQRGRSQREWQNAWAPRRSMISHRSIPVRVQTSMV